MGSNVRRPAACRIASHWRHQGRRYLLQIVECDGSPSIELKHNHMLLQLRPGTDRTRQAIVEEWYRNQIKNAVPSLIAMGADHQRTG